MTETINLWDEVKKGLRWGLALGINLDIIFALLHNSDISFSTCAVISILILVLSAVLGGITALVILGIIGTLGWINWFIVLLAGSLVAVLNIVWSTMAGWITVIVVPILYVVRKTLAEKAPKWLEKSVDISMEFFLTSLILTGLVSIFEKVTGIPLIHIWEFL